MTIEKLKRVLQRCRARNPGEKRIRSNEFRKCVMIECGTSQATWYSNKNAMVKLGWIKTNKHMIEITDKDLTEDFI